MATATTSKVVKIVRDVLLIGTGVICVGSQIVFQFRGGDPSFLVMAAGITLLTGYPLLRMGEIKKEGPAP